MTLANPWLLLLLLHRLQDQLGHRLIRQVGQLGHLLPGLIDQLL